MCGSDPSESLVYGYRLVCFQFQFTYIFLLTYNKLFLHVLVRILFLVLRKRICQMTFVGDEDDESEEIIEYRHIPPEEMLPTSVIAPCMAHLLLLPVSAKEGTPKSEARTIISKDTTKQNDKQKIDPIKTIPSQNKMRSTKELNEGVTQSEPNSKKTKTGRRRERQKQKKLLLMQCPSENGKDDDKTNSTSKDKRIRSEYFRLNGRLPLPP